MGITLLQWNIDYREPAEAIVGQLLQWQPDIVCLQEITKDWQHPHADTGAFIAQALGYHAHTAYGPMNLPDGLPAHMGVGIFSRFPPNRTP